MTDPASPALATRVQGVLDVPVHRFLGIRLVDPGRPEAGVVLPVAEPAVNNVRVLHGGVLTALLDVASYLALLPHLADDEQAVTHDVASSVLRSVPEGAEVTITAEVLRRGRRVAFLRAQAHSDGELVASGQVTKSLLRPS